MSSSTDADAPILELHDITKNFGLNRVLKGVTLKLRPGRVTALLGANGAGKSTLIKILSGVYPLTGGRILLGGKDANVSSPLEASRAGIRTVHQRIDDAIVPGLSVAENLVFEQIAQGEARPVSSLRSLLPKARQIADILNLGWDDAFLKRDVYELGIADCQMLLLARALENEPKVLILDEPTSTLSQGETERLFELILRLRDQGVAILYVSHRMGEIKALADDVAVLRDGRIVDRQKSPFDLNQAVRSMLGEDIETDLEQFSELTGDEVVLEVNQLQIFDYSAPVDFQARAGEVTAIIGLIGAGKTELLETIFGAADSKGAELRIRGKKYRARHPKDAISHGVYLVPEDRAAQSMLPGWSVEETYSLPFLSKYVRGLTFDRKAERRAAVAAMEDFKVVAAGPTQAVDALSGGNQQKVVVSRWLQTQGTILILDEPFRGVDIGARRELGRRARAAAAAGTCVVVAVSDVNEAREVADRIVVLVEGEIALDRRADQVTNEEIVQSMTEVVENE
ncbi:sugar ABC transporter ATP-binding protein [Scrofimicrobium sp. R131]|uniref:Sugar ABC transporter ATP-binding protein n=1 Tax=Scrofimicrobium appendicitidis TaxID=3079930 RepID=A0AAU7V7L3_9ACTO